eukprot:1057526-Alexandrium_andersonii.AAC.1
MWMRLRPQQAPQGRYVLVQGLQSAGQNGKPEVPALRAEGAALRATEGVSPFLSPTSGPGLGRSA